MNKKYQFNEKHLFNEFTSHLLKMKEEDFEKLFSENPEPTPDNVDKTLRSARSSVGQRDTLMFAFVKIWTVMAELLAPLFAQMAIKNSDRLSPKANTQTKQKTAHQADHGDKNA